MAQIDDLLFEVERRGVTFHKGTSMPDHSQLGYDGDPNLAVPGNSAGEFLLYNCPSGTRYLQKNVTPFAFWRKASDAAGGIWLLESSGGVVLPTLIRKFSITSAFAANEVINLTTGAGAVTGASTVSGSSISGIGASANSFNTTSTTQCRLNGLHIEKGGAIIWDTATSFHFTVALDTADVVEMVVNE